MRCEIEQPRRIKYFVRQAAIKLSISAAERDAQKTKNGILCAPRSTLTNIVTNLKRAERGKQTRYIEKRRKGEEKEMGQRQDVFVFVVLLRREK